MINKYNNDLMFLKQIYYCFITANYSPIVEENAIDMRCIEWNMNVNMMQKEFTEICILLTL